jgi:hypothetical protein
MGTIRLLHFGACSLLAGDLGHDVRRAHAPHEPFPISGFRTDVDWAGSAIVDFTYLDLVLERGLAPEDAVRETRRMLSFARAGGRDSPIAGTDLTVLDVP